MNIARTELSSREARLQHSRHISIWLLNILSSKYLHAEKKYAKKHIKPGARERFIWNIVFF